MDAGPEMALPARRPQRHLESIAVPQDNNLHVSDQSKALRRMHPRPRTMLRRHQTPMMSQHRSNRRSRGNTMTSGRSILPRRSSSSAIGWANGRKTFAGRDGRMRSRNIHFSRIASHSGSTTTTSPQRRKGNLLSAALTLYQGAVIGEFVRPGHLPKSMLAVAAGMRCSAKGHHGESSV